MRSSVSVLTATLAVVLAAPAAPAVAAPARLPAAQPAAALARMPAAAVAGPVVVARYSFDAGRSAVVTDDTGRGHTMRLTGRNGGTTRVVPHSPGFGMQFPAKCAGSRCAKAILQAPHSADLNPGTRRLAYGATVRLPRNQTSAGQNLVQKGYSASGSQYKLQIDGSAGRPSCVLVGAKTGIKLVRSSVSVADGIWHVVYCLRSGTTLQVVVDNRVRGTVRVPAGLSVVNSRPLSIGGKGVYPDNDQFHGVLDNVFVQIG